MKEEAGILELSFQMGETLLKNGAEISRVQETMERVAAAYQVETFHVYVLTNAIFAEGVEGGLPALRGAAAHSRHHHPPGADLRRQPAVPGDRPGAAHGGGGLPDPGKDPKDPLLPPAPGHRRLRRGQRLLQLPVWGRRLRRPHRLFCGVLLELFLYWAGKRDLSKFLTNLTASALVTLCGAIFLLLGVGHHMDKIIIGSIIRLVPGVALTTSIRDFFHGDYLSGAIRMLDAFLVGGCIAVGVGVVVRCLSLVTGGAVL